jgi:hypothetical protein
VTATILLLLARMVPLSDHAHVESWETTAARYIQLADIIANVDAEPLEGLTLGQTKLILAATAVQEGRMRADVMSCRVLGPRGARGAWQIEIPSMRQEACSLEHGVYAALRIMRWSWDLCRELPRSERLAGYCGGMAFMTAAARRESRRRVGPALKEGQA